jgi:hypothetical protein
MKVCNKLAEWEIWDGPRPDDYTFACTEHVGELLSDAHEIRIHNIDKVYKEMPNCCYCYE